jgi:hypothetical protein
MDKGCAEYSPVKCLSFYFLLDPLLDLDSLVLSLLLPEFDVLLSLLLADEFIFGVDCLDCLTDSDLCVCSVRVAFRCVCSGLETLLWFCSILLMVLSGGVVRLRDTFPF